jgi:hypothetical protein
LWDPRAVSENAIFVSGEFVAHSGSTMDDAFRARQSARREKSAHKLEQLASDIHSGPMLIASLRLFISDLSPHVGQSVPFPRTRFIRLGKDWKNHLEAARRILSIWVQYHQGITDLVDPMDRYRLAKGFEQRIKAGLGIWVLDTEFRELNTDLRIDEPMIRYAEKHLDLEHARQVLLRPAALVLVKQAEAEVKKQVVQPPPTTLLDQMPIEMRRKFRARNG